jgi:hypothetical protein
MADQVTVVAPAHGLLYRSAERTVVDGSTRDLCTTSERSASDLADDGREVSDDDVDLVPSESSSR